MAVLTPTVDFRPVTQYLEGLPTTGKMRAQSASVLRAACLGVRGPLVLVARAGGIRRARRRTPKIIDWRRA